MIVLVLNCGSSSIKYQLFDMDDQKVIAKGLVDKVGMKGSVLKHEKEDGQKVVFEGEILDHKIGVEYVLGILVSAKHGCIKSMKEIDAVGHRIVHGGERFNKSAFLTEEILADVTKCIDLAPLHNPPNLKGIRAIEELMPGIPQVGVFDTAFHQTMEEKAYMYGIPYVLYKKYGIRRYGFHGTSHRYVTKRACEMLGVDYEKQRIISCHLGNGASVAAVQNGKSIDTSMGMTPLEGLLMGTRAGDLDIGVVTYIMEKEGLDIRSTNTLFNKHAGVLGISGVSSDMREIETARDNGNERAKLALDVYDYRVKKYIGAYVAAMNGLDILIMTGGIGENAGETRESICSDMEWLGIELDKEFNLPLRGKEAVISNASSKVKVLIVPTNEELMIALDTEMIVSGMNKS